MSVFKQLNATCDNLLQTSLLCKTGVDVIEGERVIKTNSAANAKQNIARLQQILNLWNKHAQWLEAEKREYETFKRKQAVLQNDDESNNEQAYKEEIAKLEEDLSDLSSGYLQKQVVIERVQQTPVVLDMLFNETLSSAEEELNLILQHRDRQACEAARLYNSLNEVQSELQKLRLQNSDLRVQNRHKWEKLASESQANKVSQYSNLSNSSAVKELETSIKEQSQRAEIIRNVLKLLILESGIDWASKEDLRDVMTDSGRFQEYDEDL